MPSGIYPKELRRKFLTEQHKKKIGEAQVGKKNHNWKSNKVGYMALHDWVRKTLGKAKRCVFCKGTKSKRYQWGNISGKYKRNKKDWYEVCQSCNKTDGVKKAKRFRAS